MRMNSPLSIPKTRLRCKEDPPRGLDASDSAVCMSNSCYSELSHVLKHARVGFRVLVLSSVKGRWRRKETENRLKEVLSFSSRSSLVTVMEASHFRDLDHP